MEHTKRPLKTIILLLGYIQSYLLLFLLAFTACKKNVGPETIGTPQKISYQDSMRWQEMVRRYDQFPADVWKKDTFYLFEMHGSWGGLYHYCVIMPDSLGYVAYSKSSIGCAFRSSFCTSSTVKKRLAPEEWQSMDRKIKQSGYWYTTLQKNGLCFDCEYYQLWIKQGKALKTIWWDTTDKVPDSTRILATQMLALGGLPEYLPIGQYTDKKDSVIIRIWQITDTFFVKSRAIEIWQLNSGWIPFNGSTPKIALKSDRWSLYPADISVKEIWIDGTETTRFVTNYKKVSAKELTRE